MCKYCERHTPGGCSVYVERKCAALCPHYRRKACDRCTHWIGEKCVFDPCRENVNIFDKALHCQLFQRREVKNGSP